MLSFCALIRLSEIFAIREPIPSSFSVKPLVLFDHLMPSSKPSFDSCSICAYELLICSTLESIFDDNWLPSELKPSVIDCREDPAFSDHEFARSTLESCRYCSAS